MGMKWEARMGAAASAVALGTSITVEDAMDVADLARLGLLTLEALRSGKSLEEIRLGALSIGFTRYVTDLDAREGGAS